MDWNLNNGVYWLIGTAALAWLTLYWYINHSQWSVTDQAVDRSLHHGQALTGGGVILFLIWLLFALIHTADFWPMYAIAMLMLVGWTDDRKHLSFQIRLLLQLLASTWCLWWLGFVFTDLLAWFLLISLVWWVNLFNFMDGANGMAAIHALITLLFYAFVAQFDGQVGALALVAATITAVYLWFNLIKGQLFMGDSGSLPMGLLQAVLALSLIQSGALSMIQVAILNAVFITDATTTLVLRLKAGDKITQAHASHLYQRLIKSGASHAQVSVGYGVCTLVLGLLTLWMPVTPWLCLLLVYVGLMVVYGCLRWRLS